jgi:hypothetical protein
MRTFAVGDASEADLKKNRDAWGAEYQDEAFKFEKEWKEISAKIDNE